MCTRTYSEWILAFVCLVGWSTPTTWGQTHRVVRVSPPEIEQPAEVSVAINPQDPRQIVVVALARSSRNSYANYAFYSHDGGDSWKASLAPNPRQRTQGDDAVVFDLRGTAHRSFISFSGLFGRSDVMPGNGIYVSSSLDGGQTWGKAVPVIDHLNSLAPFEDKPYLVVDRSPESPHQNHLYLAWTRFDVYGSKSADDHSHIYFSRSVDGGSRFSSALRISDRPGDCQDSDNTVEGAMVTTGPAGEVYVAWAGPRGIEFDRSLDGGLSFGEDRLVTEMPGGWDSPASGLTRHNGMPVTGVDISQGPHRGQLYVNWIDARHGDLDVFVSRSSDRGETWSQPVRVNTDPAGNGKAQLFTWMAVDPLDGSVNCFFFDRRETSGRMTQATLARSIDGGKTFHNYPIAIPAFEVLPTVFFGDYTGIAAQDGQVVAAFPHFTADRQLIVSAAIFRFKPGTLETN